MKIRGKNRQFFYFMGAYNACMRVSVFPMPFFIYFFIASVVSYQQLVNFGIYSYKFFSGIVHQNHFFLSFDVMI